MFEHAQQLPPDPILGLNQTFQKDPNPDKINLSVGVYQNAQGQTPIFTAVKKAESELLAAQHTKSYAPQAGDPQFNESIGRLLLGDTLVEQLGDRLATVMTPGGCGALRMIAELLVSVRPTATLWVSTPTWANHFPLLQSAGLTLKEYAYYSPELHAVDFDAMKASLMAIPQGDIILLHGCCHNPTGADLNPQQWQEVLDIVKQRELLPFFDIAYQGFGDGLNEDAFAIREAISMMPEVVVANSCSKNFGLYRERTGAAVVVCENERDTAAAKSQILSAARRSYSMSPYHGGGIVGHLLNDQALTSEWKSELDQVRSRMNSLRVNLAEGLNTAQSAVNFDFLAQSKGMFCFLGIEKEQVLTLRSEFGIYLLESTRINVAGLSEQNLPVIIERVSDVISR